MDDEGARQHGRQLMEELRSALAGRATEFAARERRALAAFYGVTDDELERIEKANDAAQGHAGQDEVSLSSADPRCCGVHSSF